MRLLYSILLILILAPSYSGEVPRPRFTGRAQMTATFVRIEPGNPATRHVGELKYLGGVKLSSRQPAFGGFSAMRTDGRRFALLSDGGHIVRFEMDAGFRVSNIAFGELKDGPGLGWSKEDRDSESFTWDPRTKQYWVGFERANEIWRYAANGTPEAHLAPLSMIDWSVNGGPESMVRRRDGTFIVISETARPKDDRTAREAVLFRGDPTQPRTKVVRFAYRPPAGYDPTDMAELPDGRLLILNRRFSISRELFTAKLVIADPRPAIRATTVLVGREIATFARPLLHDNFEAVAVTQEDGATIIWIASDDNREWWEQSLLLKFRLEEKR